MRKIVIILAIIVVILTGCSSTAEVAENKMDDNATELTAPIEQSPKNIKTFETNLTQGVKFNYIDGRYNSREATVGVTINKIIFNGNSVDFEMSINNNSPASVRISTDGFTNLKLKSNGSNVENNPTEINGGKNFSKFSSDTFYISFSIPNSYSYDVDRPMSIELNVNIDVRDFGGQILEFSTELNETE